MTGTHRQPETAQKETSGVRRIPQPETDPFHHPERKHRLTIGAMKLILKQLKEGRALLMRTLAAEEESALAKKEWEQQPTPQNANMRGVAFDALERLERAYQDDFLPHENRHESLPDACRKTRVLIKKLS